MTKVDGKKIVRLTLAFGILLGLLSTGVFPEAGVNAASQAIEDFSNEIYAGFNALNAKDANYKPVVDINPVGSGKQYYIGTTGCATIDDVPWDRLGPGDVVVVPYRPQPYKYKIQIGTSGTEAAPIRIIGLRGPGGERPVFDGDGAVTADNTHFNQWTEEMGLITIVRDSGNPYISTPWGYRLANITISGLKVINVLEGKTFTDSHGQPSHAWPNFCAGITALEVQNLIIEDCELSNNQMGFFELSKADFTNNDFSSNLVFRGNYVHNNGDPDSYLVHNIYIESLGSNIIGNYFGKLRPNAMGANVTSRSTNERIIGNYIEGGTCLLDLCNPQAGAEPDGIGLLNAPQNHEPTIVANNVIVNRGGSEGAILTIKFGGTDGIWNSYRNKLVLYNNTFIFKIDQKGPEAIANWYTYVVTMVFKLGKCKIT